jgi:TDG/mug DNA glycosylase family protein
LFSPFDGASLVELGYGITNLVARATSTAAELQVEEFVEGGRGLEAKVLENSPRFVAFLGITAYRSAFGRADAVVGLQRERIGPSQLWVLPNPSGLNAHYQREDLKRLFMELRVASEAHEIAD